MNVVLDTNVIVSGLFFGGVPRQILAAWGGRAFRMVVSPPILEEYRRVGLELARGQTPLVQMLEATLTLMAVHATLVNPPPLNAPVSADRDDDKFLAAALAGRATVVVSGDKHLLHVSGWLEIAVLKPRAFVDRHLVAADI